MQISLLVLKDYIKLQAAFPKHHGRGGQMLVSAVNVGPTEGEGQMPVSVHPCDHGQVTFSPLLSLCICNMLLTFPLQGNHTV